MLIWIDLKIPNISYVVFCLTWIAAVVNRKKLPWRRSNTRKKKDEEPRSQMWRWKQRKKTRINQVCRHVYVFCLHFRQSPTMIHLVWHDLTNPILACLLSIDMYLYRDNKSYSSIYSIFPSFFFFDFKRWTITHGTENKNKNIPNTIFEFLDVWTVLLLKIYQRNIRKYDEKKNTANRFICVVIFSFQNELEALFSNFGRILSSKVLPSNPNFDGSCAFVNYAEADSCAKAVETMNNHKIDRFILCVQHSSVKFIIFFFGIIIYSYLFFFVLVTNEWIVSENVYEFESKKSKNEFFLVEMVAK